MQPLDVDNAECVEFCHGSPGTLEVVCRRSECLRTLRSPCPGDCDADTIVTIDELVSGVGIALGENSPAVCRAFDSDGDDGVTINEILRAVIAILNGCAAATPLPNGITGLFDTSITFDGQRSVQALGTRGGSAAQTTLSIDIGPNEGMTLDATARPDGQLDLDGYGIVTDIAYSVRGTALRSEGPELERIQGQVQPVDGLFAPFETAAFLMQRDVMTAAPFAGVYEFEFSASPGDPRQASSLMVALDVAPTGVAILTGGSDTGADGAVLGTVTPGRCLIAGGGSLSCSAVYLVQGSDVSGPLRLTGRLVATADGVTGSGRYLVGVDPPYNIYVFGGWSAARLHAGARTATKADR